METNKIWYDLSSKERKREIRKGFKHEESYADMAERLIGSRKNKSTIYQWAQRNMDVDRIKAAVEKPDRETEVVRSSLSKADEVTQFDIISNIFPRLDASMIHLLEEIKNLQDTQQKKFELTGSIFDQFEERLGSEIDKLDKAVQELRSKVSTLSQATQTPSRTYKQAPSSKPSLPSSSNGPPPPPGSRSSTGAPPPPSSSNGPPPPPGSSRSSLTRDMSIKNDLGPPSSKSVPSPHAELTGQKFKTNFEEMSMEDISQLPQEFLASLSTTDRTRLQNRVKELKMLKKMSPEEREAYLAEKAKEKELEQASESLGSALTSMADDENSLFAKMKRSADKSAIEGSGTFGKFMTDFIYSYCFACGKTLRGEDEPVTTCDRCGAGEELIVVDEDKLDYNFFECLDCKKKEPVAENFSRGSPIVIGSRWKVPDAEEKPNKHFYCGSENIREISSFVLTKDDPDKQMSYYLHVLKLYYQQKIKGKLLKEILMDIYIITQELPDTNTKKRALQLFENFLSKSSDMVEQLLSMSQDEATKQDIEQFQEDIHNLQTEESPQYFMKFNEINQITGKIDQMLNRMITLLMNIFED